MFHKELEFQKELEFHKELKQCLRLVWSSSSSRRLSRLVVDNGGETDIYMKKYTDRPVHEEILEEVHRQIQYRQI